MIIVCKDDLIIKEGLILNILKYKLVSNWYILIYKLNRIGFNNMKIYES